MGELWWAEVARPGYNEMVAISFWERGPGASPGLKTSAPCCGLEGDRGGRSGRDAIHCAPLAEGDESRPYVPGPPLTNPFRRAPIMSGAREIIF